MEGGTREIGEVGKKDKEARDSEQGREEGAKRRVATRERGVGSGEEGLDPGREE